MPAQPAKRSTAKLASAKPANASLSPSAHISARIKELGDWRGEMLARVRAIIQQADPAVVDDLVNNRQNKKAGAGA